eukprot:TRINITY_DN2385_c1_g1_i1.p1 TRINITY_DN2385_c1_g1~~TRINITY_DN2385_c1_g1_i1.p1  ORF type:complete len:432 (-),score=112.13 TRINITY_DN2385_c1_g1_i1:66-1361(-)
MPQLARLYFHPASIPSRVVTNAVAAAGIKVEYKVVDLTKKEQKDEAFLKDVNARGQVPALVDGEVTIYESGAILRYLLNKHEDILPAGFWPKRFAARADVDKKHEFACSARAPIYKLVSEAALKVKFFGGTADPKVVEEQTVAVKKILDFAEASFFQENADFVTGPVETVADTSLQASVEMLYLVNWDFAPWPKVQSWLETRETLTPGFDGLVAMFAPIPQLYIHPASIPSRTVANAVAAAGIKVEYKVVDLTKKEQKDEAFLKDVNARGQVPALVDGEVTIYESGAILRYLLSKHEARLPAGFWPKGIVARANVDKKNEFAASARAPIYKLVSEAALKVKFFGGTADPKVVEEQTVAVKKVLDFAEASFFQENADFVTGPVETVADTSLQASVEMLRLVKWSFAPWPKVQSWFQTRKTLTPGFDGLVSMF